VRVPWESMALHEIEREAVFFGILRERADVDAEICEWLDEAEAEGAAIVERARAEAARVQSRADASVRSLHDDVRRLQERLLDVVEQATVLLPALEAADRSLGVLPPASQPKLPRARRLARLLRRG
jgi:regulator of protease activity HflC (stomatin/prohibitin superfamily)